MKLLSSVWEVACSRARSQGNGSWGNAVEMNGTLTPYSLSGDAAVILVQMAAIDRINCQTQSVVGSALGNSTPMCIKSPALLHRHWFQAELCINLSRTTGARWLPGLQVDVLREQPPSS